MLRLFTAKRPLEDFRDLFGSMGARVVVLPISGVATILGSRIVVGATGAEGFAWFSLVISLPMLIPISDFGIGAALTDVVAKDGLASSSFWSTLKKVMSLLATIWGTTSIIAIAMATLGLWSPLLGIPDSPLVEISCAAIALFATTGIPLGAAQRVLLSLGKQTLSTLILGMGGIWSLSATWMVSVSGLSDFSAYALAYASGPFVAQLILGIVSSRILSKAYRTYRSARSNVGTNKVSVHMAAIPMAIIALALPLAYQSDRTVLAHVSSMNELASYSLVGLIYTPLLSILGVGGQTLWPMFMAQKDRGGIRRLYWRGFSIFSMLGLTLATGLVLLGPVIASIVKGSETNLTASFSTYVLFGCLLVLFAAHTTNGMLLMDVRGRTIQAIGSIALLVLKIPAAIYLGALFGADGVITSTIVAVVLCMFLPACIAAPSYWHPKRDQSPRPKSSAAPNEPARAWD